jgi:hypothetical protein
MDIVLRKKASFIEVYHQVRDEYEIVFAYAGINIPLPGSTNNNYNRFDNNDSDDSGSLSDYSLHDESGTVRRETRFILMHLSPWQVGAMILQIIVERV